MRGALSFIFGGANIMKKTIKYFVLIIMAFTISLCGITTIGSTANAELLQTTALNETEISEKINTYLAEFSQFSSRAPGQTFNLFSCHV